LTKKEIKPNEEAKMYKVFKTASGLRVTLPKESNWEDNDQVIFKQTDDDTLLIKRIIKAKEIRERSII
jgi:hypothetical protein